MIVIWTWWLGCQPPLLDWLPTASRLVTGQITYGHSFSNIWLHDLGSGVTSVQIYTTEGFAGFYTAVLLGPASYQAKCKSKFPRKQNSQVKEGAFYLFRCTSSNGSSETKRPNRAISASKARATRALKKSTSMFIATFSVSIRPWNANWFFGCGYCQEIITTSGWWYQRTEIPNKNIHANGPSFGQIAHGNAWLSHATFTRRKNVESICSCRIAGPKIKTFQDFHVNCFVYVMIFRKSPNFPIGQLVWISWSSPCHLRVETAAMYDISHFWASACKKRTAVICACRPQRTAQLVTL